VESREEVDRLHAALTESGATVFEPTHFADPDGLKLKCVFTPRPDRSNYRKKKLGGWPEE